MIFVTVGSQLPFDRLIQAMDAWTAQNKGEAVFAQIGSGKYNPKHMEFTSSLMPDSFREKCQQASLIVSHAGIGNVLLALELQKPIVLLPRRVNLNEHRNDHQMATARWLKEKQGIYVAEDCDQLDSAILKAKETSVATAFSPYASPELLGAVKSFIDQA